MQCTECCMQMSLDPAVQVPGKFFSRKFLTSLHIYVYSTNSSKRKANGGACWGSNMLEAR